VIGIILQSLFSDGTVGGAGKSSPRAGPIFAVPLVVPPSWLPYGAVLQWRLN
jgi:hypothetical protein